MERLATSSVDEPPQPRLALPPFPRAAGGGGAASAITPLTALAFSTDSYAVVARLLTPAHGRLKCRRRRRRAPATSASTPGSGPSLRCTVTVKTRRWRLGVQCRRWRVKQSDPLLDIDRGVQMQLAQAEGQLIRSAALRNARTDLDRYQTLITQRCCTKCSGTVATVAADEGAVKTDQANVDSAAQHATLTSSRRLRSGRLAARRSATWCRPARDALAVIAKPSHQRHLHDPGPGPVCARS